MKITTEDDAIEVFGLPASTESRDAILSRLLAEIELEEKEEGDQILIKCLCIQLFSIGRIEDALLIWRTKRMCFDLMCSVDIQLLCGAGLAETKQFLASSNDDDASDALDYLKECEETGDFDDFTPEGWLAYYRRYYGLAS